jgi:hypothetical protein
MSPPELSSWYALTRGRPVLIPAAVQGARVLAGPVHRLAWLGEDEAGARRRVLAWFREAVEVLAGREGGLSAVLDWWQVVALGQPALEHAWSIERAVPGPTGEALRRILELDAPLGRRLDQLRRPLLFRQVLDELAALSERNPGKIAADKQILSEAMTECRAVLRAGREAAEPPVDLRLARANETDIEAWAQEGAANRRVEPGTPVWEHLLKQLGQRAQAVQKALRLWPSGRALSISLPQGWQEAIASVCGEGADVACALVADALPETPPRALLEPQTVLQALQDPPKDPAYRLPTLLLIREATAAAGLPLPSWALSLAQRVEAFEDQLLARGQAYRGDALTALEAARSALLELDLEAAEAWLTAADEEQQQTTAGADLDRRKEWLAQRAAQLRSLGHEVPELSELDAWEREIERQWGLAREELQQLASELSAGSESLGEEGVVAEASLIEARHALGRGRLTLAHEQLQEARVRLEQARLERQQRLGPELTALWERSSGLTEPSSRLALHEAVTRAARRRAQDLPWTELHRELLSLLAHLERGTMPAAVGLPAIGRGRIRRLCWVLGGVVADGEDSRPTSPLGEIEITRGEPSDAVQRVSSWGEAVRDVPPTFAPRLYLREDEDVLGPFRVEDGEARPEHRWQAVGQLPATVFAERFGRVEISARRWLVPQPPSLEEMLQVGAVLVDRLDEQAAALWLARELQGAPPPGALAAWIEVAERDELPPELLTARLQRLHVLLGRARLLAPVRHQAIEQFLSSEAGRVQLSEALSARIAAESRAVESAVRQKRQELERELGGLEATLSQTQQALAAVERDLEQRRAEAEAEALALEALRSDRKARLLLELVGTRPARSPEVVPTRAAEPAPVLALAIRSHPIEAVASVDLPTLVCEVAGSTWVEEDVANLVLSMATGRWTLMAGLPGVGKSTFVRSVLSRLGHGPGTERYLELVVRRDWQEDAALMGFWHPTERLWMASSEGFLEHLLRAVDDARQGYGGLWPVLVEELNLASPEYYLARPLSALEAAPPVLRLYDPELAPRNAGRYPASFVVPDSVRLVGTVNVDDTVERLSPRFLSRASVLWMEARAELPPWRAEDDVAVHCVPWPALAALASREETELGPLLEVFRFLQNARVPGIPTARTRTAIARYLSAARGLLPRTQAEDLQVLQRVLPPLRGVGPRWRVLLEQLVTLLERHGWSRSAARAAELRVRGEELGDWYDFFHT